MTEKQLLQAFEWCEKKLEGFEPVIQREALLTQLAASNPVMLGHARWMSRQAKAFVSDRPKKANRWLGFIQGVLWANGLATIAEMAELNSKDNA